jgi:predicted Zn-dependent peptidase
VKLPLHTHTLANGLRLTISEDHTVPVVAVNLWYHVGSANERPGRTGFAHLFEHMLFQGSENVAANEHFALVQGAGGTLNGSTWLERTNYYETLPSHQLELALWLEADRMARLLPAMTQDKLDTQRDVVKNERRWSMDNQPYGTWWERLPAEAFPPTHPFHHSLIGSFDDLDAASLDDIREFFAAWYTPDNAVLSIVGDVDPSHAIALADKHFGGIRARAAAPPLPDARVDDHFGSWRRVVVPDDVMVPRLFLASRCPAFGSEGAFVAAIVTAVLGSGKGSRLQQDLIRRLEVATAASCFTFDLSQGRDLLVVDVTGRPEVTTDQLERDVAALLDELVERGVSDAEVARAKALTVTEFVTSLQSAQSRADRVSQFATLLGDPAAVNTWPDHLQQVTTSQVNAFIRDWMGKENRLSLVYVPREGSDAIA